MGKSKNNESNTGGKKKRLPLIIAGVILGIILLVVIIVSVIAGQNVNAMNSCIDASLAMLEENYTLTPVDAGEYEEMTISGIMKFDVEQYHIEELGNLSIMRMNMGVMQMSTFVITPTDKNMPLFSADYIYILSNRKAYLEFYDVVKEKDDAYNELIDALTTVRDNYNYLEDFEASEAWYEHLLSVVSYKSADSKQDDDLQAILTESLQAYIDHAKQFPALSEDERNEKLAITVEYTDGLIEKGGVSTDVFKKELGNEETKKFFDNVFFGTSTE